MADKYLSNTGLTYYHNRIKNLFATQDDLDTLEDKVDDIIAEGGEPNVIESISVNGTPQTITSKNVDLSVPTEAQIKGYADEEIATSIDDTGDDTIASKGYVDENGGKIDVIKVNGTTQTITNKEVNLTVPTKTSDLTNDSDFQTEAEVQALIDDELSGITGIEFEVVQTLPATGVKGTIYLVHKTGTTGDLYDEYIWVQPTGQSAHFEKIGTTDIDLSDYWAKSELVAITTAEIDALFV